MARIVIIGGGIGGLALGASLHKRGITCSIYERAGELRDVGAAIGLWPNASRVLKHLGVLETLIAGAHTPPAGVLRSTRGRILLRMATLETDVPAVFAHRAEAHRAILSAVPANAIFLNKACTTIVRDGPRVRAEFADGTKSEWGEGLVGADGIHSRVRALTLNDGPPTYRGYVAWRGVATNFQWKEEMVGQTDGRGQRFGFIPLGRRGIGWWAAVNKSQAEADQACARSQAEWKKEVLGRYQGWHAPIPQLLEATPESAYLCNAIMDRPVVAAFSPWGEGAVTLLGDAAHPMTPNLGQGACMAIEDAAVLAHALASMPEVGCAFRAYERTRFARTSHVTQQSLEMGRVGQWQNPIACALRSVLYRLAPERRMRKQFRELWCYDAWEAPLESP